MKSRASTKLMIFGVLMTACSNPAIPPPSGVAGTSAPPDATSSVASPGHAARSPSPVAGGCGDTQVFAGPGPDAALGLSDNPWAPASPTEVGIVAYFWSPPPAILAASGSSDHAPKVLWVSHQAQADRLMVSAHPAASAAPVLRFVFPAASSPAGRYPSSIEIPEPGCWHFDLAIGGTHASMDLSVTPGH